MGLLRRRSTREWENKLARITRNRLTHNRLFLLEGITASQLQMHWIPGKFNFRLAPDLREDKRYYEKFLLSEREIFIVSINYRYQQRQFDDWKAKRLSEQGVMRGILRLGLFPIKIQRWII